MTSRNKMVDYGIFLILNVAHVKASDILSEKSLSIWILHIKLFAIISFRWIDN